MNEASSDAPVHAVHLFFSSKLGTGNISVREWPTYIHSSIVLNFAPAPSKLPLTDTMATVESGARKLTPEDAHDLRGRVCGILRRAKVPRSNLTKEQRTALKELRGLEDEVILPADKGNATVMMRR